MLTELRINKHLHIIERRNRDVWGGINRERQRCESTQVIIKITMWLRATGFASNCYNECILFPLIKSMPGVHPSSIHTNTHTHVFVSLHRGNFTNLCDLTLRAGDNVVIQIYTGVWCWNKDAYIGVSQLIKLAMCVFVHVLSLQIGLWHSEEGLSMEKALPSVNVTDTLFNTTLTITTILVRSPALTETHTHTRASAPTIFFAEVLPDLYVATLQYTGNYHIKSPFCFGFFQILARFLLGSEEPTLHDGFALSTSNGETSQGITRR